VITGQTVFLNLLKFIVRPAVVTFWGERYILAYLPQKADRVKNHAYISK